MKIILKQTVESLGKAGDIVNIEDGVFHRVYNTNYNTQLYFVCVFSHCFAIVFLFRWLFMVSESLAFLSQCFLSQCSGCIWANHSCPIQTN